ncbi:MAG: uroporphyrinogen-III synthase [Culturomica sp.]|nr:uroporphyrinogen-III synthase [Culturomica sp.]
MKLKKILVSQPKPEGEKSPYSDLADKFNMKVEFQPFIQVQEVDGKEFRNTHINILDHTAVIFTSRTSIDNFFRVCGELRITVPETMKYFCISESIAFYLQKYIVYRKRKIFFGDKSMDDMKKILLKHKNEFFLVPLSDIHKENIPLLLDNLNIKYTKAILYRTVSSDLKDKINIKDYNVLVFYTPSGIKSLFQNFPDFQQESTIIAAFGNATAEAVEQAGLRLDVKAPTPENPSMTMAIEKFIKQYNKENKIKS